MSNRYPFLDLALAWAGVGFFSSVISAVMPHYIERLWCRIRKRPTLAEQWQRKLDRVIELEADQTRQEAELDQLEADFERNVAHAQGRG